MDTFPRPRHLPLHRDSAARVQVNLTPTNHQSCVSGAPKPASPADRAELLLLRGVPERGVVTLGRWRIAAEEADLDLADEPTAELRVADARRLVGRGRLGARDRRCDVVSDYARSRLGEDAGLRNSPRAGTDVAERVDAGEPGPEVGLVDGHPIVDDEACFRERGGRPVD